MQKQIFPGRALPYALLFPQILVIVIFFILPTIESFQLSLYQGSPFGGQTIFIGLKNFFKLFSSHDYLMTVWVSIIFSTGVGFCGIIFSLFIAVFVHASLRGKPFYRTAFIWPYALSPAICGVIWMFIFHPTYGVVSYYLPFRFNWLLDGTKALAFVIGAATWSIIGYDFAFYLAALQAIPKVYLEAADIDGAGPGKKFWHIMLPLLSPTTFFLFIMNVIYASFETFGIIYAITQGGPGGSTNIMVFRLYEDGFINLQLGYSAAQSIVLLIFMIVFTLVQFKFTEKKVFYA